MKRLLREGIIEPSYSLWRAQVVVNKEEDHEKRLVTDASDVILATTLDQNTILVAFVSFKVVSESIHP